MERHGSFLLYYLYSSPKTAGSWDNYQRNFDRIWSQVRKITKQRRYQLSFYNVKITNKLDFIILFLPVVLIQISWLEMHMDKNVWIYRSLFISAVYTSKLWITSFSETVKKFLQQHQLNWFERLQAMPKVVTRDMLPSEAEVVSPPLLQPFSAWKHGWGAAQPRLQNIWFSDVLNASFLPRQNYPWREVKLSRKVFCYQNIFMQSSGKGSRMYCPILFWNPSTFHPKDRPL